jgi:hypothetical protein
MILAKKGKTELDVCEEHGVWLDSRELEEILRRRRIGEATRMQMAERHGREWGKVSAYWLGELAFLFDRNTKSAHGPRPGSKASARSRSLRSE